VRAVQVISRQDRRVKTHARACALVVCLAFTPSPAQQAVAVDRHAATRTLLTRAIADEMQRCALPGLSIALADGNDIVWTAGFGVEEPGRKRPVAADAPFRVASISKLCTATAVMQAVERGELDLDADVATYLPTVRPRGFAEHKLTLRHLMTHTGGVLREPPVGHYFDLAPPALAVVAGALAGTELVAAPGSLFKYSNAGVACVGRLLEARAGVAFADLVQRTVLTPLGLPRARFSGNGDERVLQGVMWTYDGRAIPTPRVDLGLGPAANLCASMPDLVRMAQSWFLGAHRAPHALLREETLRAMFTPQFNFPFMGLGFFLGQLDGARMVSHQGAYYGVASLVAALPEEGLAVALAVTMDFASGPVERLGHLALRCLRAARQGNELPAPPAQLTPPGAARARALAGRYGQGPASIELLARGDHLWLRPRAGEWQQLFATEDPQLLVAADRAHTGRDLRVVDDGVQLGQQTLARQEDTMPPPCPDELLPYLGEYGWDHDVLLVFERDGSLCILIEWLAEYPTQTVDAKAGRFALDRQRGLYHAEELCFARDGNGAVAGVHVGAVYFPRRALLGVDGGSFRVAARHPKERLLAMAQAARAPAPAPGARAFDLVELKDLDPSLRYDIRYAGSDNFLGFAVYEQAAAKLQRPAAEALVRVQRALAPRGLGLLIHDAYRPWQVTKMFYDATPDAQRHFVADPSKGSRHNRGCAVDLTLCDRETGVPVVMPSLYDEFTPRAYPDYPGGTSRQRWLREVLRAAMEAEGFAVYEFEWWHFDSKDWASYPVK
jgi:D-alanyl-D-alanine dipeptidase/CubicO group peptidase (beta-lactamase class C family)